jgi:hypothetical protein
MGAAFLIPTLLSAAGTAAQYVNTSQANSRQNAAETQAIIGQQQDQSKAAGDVNKLTQQIATNTPQQLQDKATSQYVQQLRSNAASTQPGAAAAPGADARYVAGQKAAGTEVQNYGDTLAAEKGATDAAVRQRQNEGLGMGDLATQLSGINQKSYGQAFVDQLRAQAAGTQNPWVTAGASALQNGASTYAKNSPYGPAWGNGTPFSNPDGSLNYDPGSQVPRM